MTMMLRDRHLLAFPLKKVAESQKSFFEISRIDFNGLKKKTKEKIKIRLENIYGKLCVRRKVK